MKKLLLTVTILALILCLGSVVYAAEGEGEGILTTENLTTTEAVVGSDTAANSDITTTGTPDTGFTPLPDESLPAEGDTNTETPEEGETSLDDLFAIIEELNTMIKPEEPYNVAEWLIYKLFGDWAPIVYLVLVGALGIVLLWLEFKKRLPADKSFRETISKGLAAFTEDTTKNNGEFTSDITAKVDGIKTSIAEALTSVQAVIEKVAELQKKQDTAEKDRTVEKTSHLLQASMLETVIQASSLTQWKKDLIEKSYGTILKAIADMEETEDPEAVKKAYGESLRVIEKMLKAVTEETESTDTDTDTTEGGEGV